MISQEAAEKALDHLRDTAESCAKARAERLYLDEYSKSLRSILMSEHLSETLGAQERHALSDERYIKHLEALKEAIFQDERGRFLREAAESKIRAWQTEQANLRGG